MAFFNFKKILQENLPSYSWLAAIVGPINKGFEDVQRILNSGLTFSQNMSASVNTVTLDGIYPVYVSWPLPAKPVGAWVIVCRELSGVHVTFTTAIFLDWTWDGERIKIDGVTGITPTSTAKFNLSFIAITG